MKNKDYFNLCSFKTRDKQGQNVPLSVIVFKSFSVVSNGAGMHHLASFKKQQIGFDICNNDDLILCSSISFQVASECTRLLRVLF